MKYAVALLVFVVFIGLAALRLYWHFRQMQIREEDEPEIAHYFEAEESQALICRRCRMTFNAGSHIVSTRTRSRYRVL